MPKKFFACDLDCGVSFPHTHPDGDKRHVHVETKMTQTTSEKLIRIYGVEIPLDPDHGVRPYGNGTAEIEGKRISYVDYFINDLVGLILNQGLTDIIIKKLNVKKNLPG